MTRPENAACVRSLNPLWQEAVGPAMSVKELECVRCEIEVARALNASWHSRLPHTQRGPWQFAFAAHKHGIVYAVALWHNPSARTLPSHWVELRRLAIAPDAPHCTASWMLSRMIRWFQANTPDRERAISYQDCAVHSGTIYKAAGWQIGLVAKPRLRDRSEPRKGTRRDYRRDANGKEPAGSAKVRWEKELRGGRGSRHDRSGIHGSTLSDGVAGQVYDPFGTTPAPLTLLDEAAA